MPPSAQDRHQSRKIIVEIAEATHSDGSLHGICEVATDGSAKRFRLYSRTVAAVTIRELTSFLPMPGDGQTSYAAERLDAHVILEGGAISSVPFLLAIDNLDVQGIFAPFLTSGNPPLPISCADDWLAMREAPSQCSWLSCCIWIPRHGKFPAWQAARPFHITADILRDLNDQADKAALECKTEASLAIEPILENLSAAAKIVKKRLS